MPNVWDVRRAWKNVDFEEAERLSRGVGGLKSGLVGLLVLVSKGVKTVNR